MTKVDKLVEMYTAILQMIDIEGDDEGLLFHTGSKQPITIDGKRVALPTKQNLKNMRADKLIMFHPLSENLFEGMSDVFLELRYLVASKLHKIIISTGYTLLKLAVDNASHSELSDSQMSVLSLLAGADAKLVDNYKKLSNELKVISNKQMINIYVKKNSKIKETEYMRAAHVSFPLLELLHENEDGVIHGVKFRKKDIPILIELFTAILPKHAEVDAYSGGSNSSVAPYFMSLFNAFINVVSETGGPTWKFRSHIKADAGESLHITPDDLIDLLVGDDAITSLVNAIPPMPYNTGDDKAGLDGDDAPVEKATQRMTRESRTPQSRRTTSLRQEEVVDEVEDLIDDVLEVPEQRGGLRNRQPARRDYGYDREDSRGSSRGGLRSQRTRVQTIRPSRDDGYNRQRVSRTREPELSIIKRLPRI